MKSSIKIILGIVACLVLIAVGYFWATGLMDSLYAFRSPLSNDPPVPGDTLLPSGITGPTRRVVFVLIDALRLDTSLDSSVMPFLNMLRLKGASASMHSQPPSYSEPGYTVLLTGAWPDLSDGPAMNLDYELIPTWTQDNLFSAAHRRGLKTAISAYYWYEKLISQETVDASFYTLLEDQTADRQVLEAALPWLHEGSYQFVLIHLDQVDYAGHYEGGPRDPRWNQAAARVDAQLAEIVATLDLNQDTLFVCSDHGQIDRGGHGGQEPIVLLEPFVLVGAGVKPGSYGDVNMVDVAPTLAALLGTNLPASSQGHVLTQMLDLPQTVRDALPAALQAQQDQLLKAYFTAIGREASIPPGEDTVAVHQNALAAARSARLTAERIPRFFLALILALVPAVSFLRRWQARRVWYLLAGVVYLLAFNLRYAVLDGRTYSLSSVASATDILVYGAITSLIALVLGWIIFIITLQPYCLKPILAAEAGLYQTLTVLYLLSLLILWSFAMNGIIVTWALPDFASQFLGFLSLIQIIFVTLFGLILTGLTSLAARFWTH